MTDSSPEENRPVSQMIRVPSVLISSVRLLADLHRKGHTNAILQGIAALISDIDSRVDTTDITAEIKPDILDEIWGRFAELEARLAALEGEKQPEGEAKEARSPAASRVNKKPETWLTTGEAFLLVGGDKQSQVSSLDGNRKVGWEGFRKLEPEEYPQFGLECRIEKGEKQNKRWFRAIKQD